jgi:hypothetical protein
MRARALTLALAASLAAPSAFGDNASAQVERMFLERTAIAASDKACNLFTEGERLALKSGLYQSEGELLRAGYSRGRLDQLAGEVRTHAKALGCDHPSVLQVAGTIRASYRQFAKTNFLEYPAASSTWGASRSEHDVWAVNQTDKPSSITLGLRREDEDKPEAFTLAVAIPWTKQPPAAVQLYMRDLRKMSDPWLPTLFGPEAKPTPAARSISRPEWTGRVEEYEDNVGDYYLIYYFAPSAIERLEQLDPREAVQLELTPNPLKKDKTPVRVNFEVGDVRAARAFAMIPKPPVSTLALAAAAAAEAAPAGGH